MDTVMIFRLILKLRSTLHSSSRWSVFLIFGLSLSTLYTIWKSYILNLTWWIGLVPYESIDVDWPVRVAISIALSSVHDVTKLRLLICNDPIYSTNCITRTCHVRHLNLPSHSGRSDSTGRSSIWNRALALSSFTADVCWVLTTNRWCKRSHTIIFTVSGSWYLNLLQLRVLCRLWSISVSLTLIGR